MLSFHSNIIKCVVSSHLQVELQAASNKHDAEVFELKHQISGLNSLLQKGNQALQQKAQVITTVHAVDRSLVANTIVTGLKEGRVMRILLSSQRSTDLFKRISSHRTRKL